jgi:hypothetical protein
MRRILTPRTFIKYAQNRPYLFTFLCQQMEDIKLDVQHAREAPTEHPQWEFEDEDEEDNSKADESDDQVTIRILF